ncbi:MAG: DNA alkylation repair enzyme [bacterium ADurb.Bin400]|nr:MAG: DNA alkylation repair enzyme [bacterium ADurb.Bin400]
MISTSGHVQVALKQISEEIAKLPKKEMSSDEQAFIQRYLGSTKKYLGTKTADNVKIARIVLQEQTKHTADDLVCLLDHLFSANTFEEHAIGGKIFTLLKPEIRSQIPFTQLEKWLAKAKGWVEIDVICQSSFTGAEALARWNDWKNKINKFAKSDNISLRRASLVLQVPVVGKTNDPELRQLAFTTIEQLKHEKDGLITKAVSWLLRSLSVLNKEEVKDYLIKNESTLPRIAFRETMKKIETGKKNGNKKK